MTYDEPTRHVAPPKLLVERLSEGPVTCLRLSGAIDEQFDGPGLSQTIEARWLILDLGGVDRISSFGIRQWIDFIAATAARVAGIYFVECSPKMMDQFNMVANFGGSGHIVSFYAPYRCDACDHDRRRLFRTDEETPLWRAGQAPAFACPTCGSQEYFDEDPATYFACVSQQAPLPLPPEVTAFLRARLSYGQGGQRKLKIEKRVEGRLTYVKLAGDLDSDLRAPKLADGLEGEVAFDLLGVLSIDPVGMAQWRKLVQSIEPVDRVHLLGVPAPFLERLGRPEDLTRKGQVLSVLVPYNCPRCRAATQRLVDFVAHGPELRAGRVPRTQCGVCGTPAVCVASDAWLQRIVALPVPQLDEELHRVLGHMLGPAGRPAPGTSTGVALGSGARPGAAPAERPDPAPPGPTTQKTPQLRLGLRARIAQILYIPGLVPGLLVVLLALSGAIVFRILSPPAGRRVAGYLVVASSQPRPPEWLLPAHPQPEPVFVGHSPVLPDLKEAQEQAEAAALAALADRLAETLAAENADFRRVVVPLYAAAEREAQAALIAEEAPALTRLKAREAERRVAQALRDAAGLRLQPQLYWDKLARVERAGLREPAYRASARVELPAPSFERLRKALGQAEDAPGVRVLPYFPLLAWRHDLLYGAVVVSVDPAFAAAGLQPGDIVVAIMNQEVRGAAEFGKVLRHALGLGGSVPFKIQRGERLSDIQVPLGRGRRRR